MSEIAGNDYNLNISRYIDTSEDEVIIDIKATMEDISDLVGRVALIPTYGYFYDS